MKRAITVANVLSWVNLIIAGALGLFMLLGTFLYQGAQLQFLIFIMLFGCIILHSYASLQLHKSISNINIPLNKQTPVGIRIMGYMALFFTIILFTQAIFMLQHSQELSELSKQQQAQFQQQVKNINFKNLVRGTGIFMVIFSLSVILNVILNLRFLKWYTIMQNNEPK